MLCDHIDGANQHLRHHDVSLVVDAGDICCTFQVRSRGGDPLIGAYRDPDLTRPRANEMGCGNLSDWVRLRNEI